nr:hypothetical protein Itr_chr06CG20150 [Ipomoea trifida]
MHSGNRGVLRSSAKRTPVHPSGVAGLPTFSLKRGSAAPAGPIVGTVPPVEVSWARKVCPTSCILAGLASGRRLGGRQTGRRGTRG